MSYEFRKGCLLRLAAVFAMKPLSQPTTSSIIVLLHCLAGGNGEETLSQELFSTLLLRSGLR